MHLDTFRTDVAHMLDRIHSHTSTSVFDKKLLTPTKFILIPTQTFPRKMTATKKNNFLLVSLRLSAWMSLLMSFGKAFSVMPESSALNRKVGQVTKLLDWAQTSLEKETLFPSFSGSSMWTYEAKPLVRKTFQNE